MDFGTELIDLSKVNFTPKLLGAIPAEIGLRYRVLPIFDNPESLGMVIANANDFDTIDAVQVAVKRPIEIFCADPIQLVLFVERCYGRLD